MNIEKLGAGDQCTIIAGDAWQRSIEDAKPTTFDLVLLDPPYDDSRDATPTGVVRQYLGQMDAATSHPSIIVLHHARDVLYELDPAEAWRIMDQRTIGSNGITFFVR